MLDCFIHNYFANFTWVQSSIKKCTINCKVKITLRESEPQSKKGANELDDSSVVTILYSHYMRSMISFISFTAYKV